MPKENRKRGKKHKRTEAEAVAESHDDQPSKETLRLEQPSWIHSAEPTHEHNPEAPYGYVDNDVKAYFRTVDVQIRDWQEDKNFEDVSDGDKDPNEDRHLFFVAALSEMSGKERQLATDPDCSVILERMAHSMDDFVRRVFVDSLAGSFETLSKHRFASHVCQTMFTVARGTVSRETRGIVPDVPKASKHGELRSMTQLILDVCEELLPSIGSLIMDPFASHVVRSLLLLLTPSLAGEESSTSTSIRSKKSLKWKSKLGPMKSVFAPDKGQDKKPLDPVVPPAFRLVARQFVESLRSELSDSEVRALAANKAASPALKMLIEAEADQDMANLSGSLMDSVTMGLVSSCLNGGSLATVQPSDYVNTLLRDVTSSHLLEAVIAHCPTHVFSLLWKTYFSGTMLRLAVHPVANFVVAKAVERVSPTDLGDACDELKGSWNRLLESMRITVIRAFVDRSAKLRSSEDNVLEGICSAFGLTTSEDRVHVVPCVLYLKSLTDYRANSSATDLGKGETMEPTIHGSQLLQALLRLSEQHNELVIESLNALAINERILLAQNSYSSRIYDVLLESDSVSPKAKRKTVMDFIGHYHLLVDDRIGSRVADRFWEYADTYFKEKIARSLIPHDRNFAASYYGRFFARNLNLQLLQRRPEEWRNMQAELRKQKGREQQIPDIRPSSSGEKVTPPLVSKRSDKAPQKRKRKGHKDDELDALFAPPNSKKAKRPALESGESERATKPGGSETDMQSILQAIKAAPDHEKSHKRKR